MKSIGIVVASVLLGAVCLTANAQSVLQCYDCIYESATKLGDEGCMDPFDEANISNSTCDGVCMKQIIESSNSKVYTRRCRTMLEGECNEMNNVKSSQGTITQICCIDTLCNKASVINFSIAVTVFIPLAFRLF